MIGISLSMIAGTLGLIFPQTNQTVLFYSWELDQEVPLISTKGIYSVWVAAPFGCEDIVRVGGREFAFTTSKKRNGQDGVTWSKAGESEVEEGPLQIHCGASIVAVGLSTAPNFNPEAVLKHVRVLPLDESVVDNRADEVRDTNTVYTFPRYDQLHTWESKAEILRKRILLSCGLYPIPVKPALNAKVFDEVVYDEYSVSKVCFEPWPGLLATGNLYRPLGQGPFPGVINPHGHWQHGRLEDSETGSVPARCITLARMGIVAFSYDMIGYVDSQQLKHTWGGNREKIWGLHPFGVQLWTSIRALDFLESLEYVDKMRLGCTGASGGGTQTFALTAVDPRVRVSVPVNMISSTMQGGCLCENAPIIRLDNSNMEIGALAAPRPLLLVSATGDWTRETPRVEFPAIRSIYALYDASTQVENVHLHYGHNYNQASREAMYRFMGKHLLDMDIKDFKEPPYVKPPDEILRVFPEGIPKGYLTGNDLLQELIRKSRERRAAKLTKAQSGSPGFSAYDLSAVLGVTPPHPTDLYARRTSLIDQGDYILESWVFGRSVTGDAIPALFYRSSSEHAQDAVIIVHGRGKAYLVDSDNGVPGPLIKACLDKGKAVLALDAFLLGEHHRPKGLRVRKQAEKFQDTFQVTDMACKVQDILTAHAFLKGRYDMTGITDLVGLEDAGIWSIFAAGVDLGFNRIFADLGNQDLQDDALWEERFYVPSIRVFGDIPAALIIGDPRRFYLFNAATNPELDALPVATLLEVELAGTL